MKPADREPSLDDLLADIHDLIDDEQTPEASRPLTAEDITIDFDDLSYGAYTPEPEPAPKPKAYWTQTQKLPKHVAKLQQNQEQAYAEWLYAQDHRTAPETHHTRHVPEQEEEIQPIVKKKHRFRNALLVLLTLAILLFAAVAFLLPKQPQSDAGLGARRQGVSTILLAGTDQDGTRTDTLMLLTADRSNGMLSLVSIPRDTLVNGSYNIPKINSVYGANNGGAEGIEMLMTRVAECIGFRPDGYILIQMSGLEALVDTMGGVTFDVPVDMYYNDPTQDLFINLTAGRQTLSGKEAMGVLRYRAGYADADLGRVQVQRSFLSAAIDQLISLEGIAKAPQLLSVLLSHTDSDLTTAHYLWLAETALLADHGNIQTATLPGSARNIYGGSYYVLDPALVAQTVNTYCNPYQTEITTDHLTIRQG